MVKQVQIRRGTTVENDMYTGAQGELTMDTEKKELRLHDGTTQGGHMIDTVVAWQAPTAENNYTWYRKYASGWVEQGGRFSGYDVTITLPVVMSDTNYNIQSTGTDTVGGGGYQYTFYRSQTITGFKIVSAYAGNWYNNSGYWQVSGIAA